MHLSDWMRRLTPCLVFFYTEEPTTTSPYEGTWYEDYDEYGSMCTHNTHTHTHNWNKSVNKCCILDPLFNLQWDFLPTKQAAMKIGQQLWSTTFQIYNWSFVTFLLFIVPNGLLKPRKTCINTSLFKGIYIKLSLIFLFPQGGKKTRQTTNGLRRRGRELKKKERSRREVRKPRCRPFFYSCSLHSHVRLHAILSLPMQRTWPATSVQKY